MRIETIFAYIRFSINKEITELDSDEDLDWDELYQFAKKQAIAGVLFPGIARLPKEKRPEKKLLMKWYVLTEKIKARNERLNEAVVEVTEHFTHDGFPNCVLKGQGNALMYPNPELRMPGDIDLWPLGERERIYKYVRKDFPDTEMLYHHLEYPIIKDVMTEVHFFPMFLNNPLYNWRFQKWLKAVGKAQCENRVELPNGGHFSRPTAAFNAVYQLVHIRHHFFDEGIGLRQLMDYYFLIRDEEIREKRDEICALLKKFGLYSFAQAVMYVMKEVFGLEERYLFTCQDEKVGRMLLDEIMLTGNFGHEDTRFGNLKKRSRLIRLYALLGKNMRFWWNFPGEVIFAFLFRLSQPLWRQWANFKYSQP